MTYFLEVSIARDFVEDWIASLDEKPSSSAIRQRLIRYAIFDAWENNRVRARGNDVPASIE